LVAMRFEKYLDELANPDRPLRVSQLERLANLDPEDLALVRERWPRIPADRRRRLLTEAAELAEDNVELNFDGLMLVGLEDPDAGVRAAAVAGLWENDSRKVLVRLLALVEGDPAEEVRAAAAVVLGRHCARAQANDLLPRDSARLRETLLRVFDTEGESVEVRRRALEALGVFDDEQVAAAIERAYRHTDRRLRVSALYAMGRSCDRRWLPLLAEALSSPDPEVRFEAVRACGEIGDRTMVGRLVSLLDDPDLEVRLAAIGALGKIGGGAAKRVLQRYLTHPDEAVRDAADEALGELGFFEDPLGRSLV